MHAPDLFHLAKGSELLNDVKALVFIQHVQQLLPLLTVSQIDSNFTIFWLSSQLA